MDNKITNLGGYIEKEFGWQGNKDVCIICNF